MISKPFTCSTHRRPLYFLPHYAFVSVCIVCSGTSSESVHSWWVGVCTFLFCFYFASVRIFAYVYINKQRVGFRFSTLSHITRKEDRLEWNNQQYSNLLSKFLLVGIHVKGYSDVFWWIFSPL